MSLISKILGFFTNKKKIQEVQTISAPEKVEPTQTPSVVESTVEEVKSEVPASVDSKVVETVDETVEEVVESTVKEVSEKPKVAKKLPSKQTSSKQTSPKQLADNAAQNVGKEVAEKTLTTEEKVIEAIKALKEVGNVTISNIVKTSGISRPTVQKYVKTLPEEYKILIVKVKG